MFVNSILSADCLLLYPSSQYLRHKCLLWFVVIMSAVSRIWNVTWGILLHWCILTGSWVWLDCGQCLGIVVHHTSFALRSPTVISWIAGNSLSAVHMYISNFYYLPQYIGCKYSLSEVKIYLFIPFPSHSSTETWPAFLVEVHGVINVELNVHWQFSFTDKC